MPTSTAAFNGSYTPSYTFTEHSIGRPRHPVPEQFIQPGQINVQSSSLTSIPSGKKSDSKAFKTFKILIIAFFGAGTAIGVALAIALPYFTLTATTKSTVTTSTVTTSTVTTSTTTTATTTTTTTSSTSTTSATTTTTTRTTTTTTTTTTTASSFCVAPCVCGGISSNNLWQGYSSNGMYMDIITSNCNFTRTPSYFTSISGTGDQWLLIGHNAIYSQTSTSFRIYVTSLPGLSTASLLNSASTLSWNVNWVGTYN